MKNNFYKVFEKQDISKVSDLNLAEKLPQEQKEKIEDLIKKHLSDVLKTKNMPSIEEVIEDAKEKKAQKSQEKAPDQKTDQGQKKSENKKIEESADPVTGAVFVASIVPLILEAVGNFVNWVSRETGITMTKDQYEKYKVLSGLIYTYKQILSEGFDSYPVLGSEGNVHANFWLKNGGESGNQLKWFLLGKYATQKLQKLGIKDLDLNWETQIEKNENLKFLMTYESFLIQEEVIGKIKKFLGFDDKKDKTKNKDAAPEKLFGDKHHHHSKSKLFPSDYKPMVDEEQDVEFIKNQINKIEDWMQENLPMGSKLGNALIDGAHKLHAAYTWIIRVLLWTLYQCGVKWLNRERRHRIANVCYAVGMLCFFGVATWEKITHLPEVAHALGTAAAGTAASQLSTTILKMWKSGSNIQDILKHGIEAVSKEAH